jgi:hypothetical protein
MVNKLLSESSRPRDAEFECFDLYLDYCRASVDNFQGAERAQAIQALQQVFSKLDQAYTQAPKRVNAETTKQATSILAHGQNLAYCSAQIEKDVQWLPLFYTTAETPCGKAMAKPLDSRVREPEEAATAAAAAAAQPASVAQRYHSMTNSGQYDDEITRRVAAAHKEIEADPAGFEYYLQSRAAIHDPRVSDAVFAANSMRRSGAGLAQTTADRAVASMAGNYAGSRIDPYFHSQPAVPSWAGPSRLSAAAGAGRTQAEYHAAAYARVGDPLEYSRYGLRAPTVAHHARYHARHGAPF